mgnify:CR=1 FL=1
MSISSEISDLVTISHRNHMTVFSNLENILSKVDEVASVMTTSILGGNKIIWMGNGGSASQSQHFAAELIGRFKIERNPIASISISSDTSSITAIGNDYDFSEIYSRQIHSICKPKDVVVCISTSGNSKNILKAASVSKEIGAIVVGLTGKNGGQLSKMCHHNLNVPSDETARIQEAHLWLGHTLCEQVELNIFEKDSYDK